MTPSLATLAVGTINAQVGHPAPRQAARIAEAFDAAGLDVLAVTEAADYIFALRREFGLSRVLARTVRAERAERQQVWIVRDPDAVAASWVVPVRRTWLNPAGRKVGPMYPRAVKYAGALLVAVHAPVGVTWRAGVPVGPPRRVLAYREHTNHLARLACRHPACPLAIVGDFNAHGYDRGPWTPSRLAARIGGDLAFPARRTSRHLIDGVVYRGGVVTDFTTTRTPWSDHDLQTFTFTYDAPGGDAAH